MPIKRLTRPTSPDIREWEKLTRDALNEAGVRSGEEFVIVPLREMNRPERATHVVGTEEAANAGLATAKQHGAFKPPAEPPEKKKLGPFSRDSETSRKAALANYPRKDSQWDRVLMAVFAAGDAGMTRDELSQALGLADSSIDARVWEHLGDYAMMKKSGRTRRTQRGSEAEVLILTEKGLAEAKKRAESEGETSVMSGLF